MVLLLRNLNGQGVKATIRQRGGITFAVPNESRQPTPVDRLAAYAAPLARRGCAHRYPHA